ncbi:helix-hairpin-helix domain-containing protein [Mangrovivirga sp. M17]|uniref:Helix-hairpin-helix domain-containing protein n=1 Tax=Mangrovivirga halotolerans TaxID=2993936 RepID=A0ABT3RPX7_9BACT|nr:helix-hairpin-helix domain-containing protein [Mangrovivirga halotolerans]MCX2743424.1 helix-hairpin-helix domain-containing protein [Mangrovivirga halotolerans]
MRFITRTLRRFLSSFYFNRSEASGFLLLAILLISYIFVLKWGDIFFENNDYRIEYQYIEGSVSSNVTSEKISSEIENNSLDPNISSRQELISSGLPDYLADRLINYRNKGGKFYKRADLKKIYGLNDSLYNLIHPYYKDQYGNKLKPQRKVSKPYVKDSSKSNHQPFKPKEIYSFDINEADTIDLKQIYGIGSVLSQRIIKYRNSLGGFISANQLYEVWGLEKSVADELLKHASIVNGFEPRKLSITNTSIDSLASHPYLSFKQAKLMKSYYQSHENGFRKEDFYKIYAIDSASITRILPYLTF